MRYTYHSEHNAGHQHRWMRFLLFAGAFLLLLAGLYELFLFFTDWSAAEDDHAWWYLALAVLYLSLGGLLTYAGLRHLNGKSHPEERFLTVSDDAIRWSLTQDPTTHELPLEDLAGVERLNVRDLRLTTKSGEHRVVPIYLIANEPKQEQLLTVLNTYLQQANTPA